MNKYKLKKEVLNFSTGHIVPVGEIFIQLDGTRKYQSVNGWQMSEAACLNKDWFEELVTEPSIVPETKYMNTIEAYNEGFQMGVNWCKKYGTESTEPFVWEYKVSVGDTFKGEKVEYVGMEGTAVVIKTKQSPTPISKEEVEQWANSTGNVFPNKTDLASQLQSPTNPKCKYCGVGKTWSGHEDMCSMNPKNIEPQPSTTVKDKQEGWEVKKLSTIGVGGAVEIFGYHEVYEKEIQSGRFKIHSVKRLSDNTVFSIGSRYFINGYMNTIQEFRIVDKYIRVLFIGLNVWYDLSELPPTPNTDTISTKTVLFTEDNMIDFGRMCGLDNALSGHKKSTQELFKIFSEKLKQQTP